MLYFCFILFYLLESCFTGILLEIMPIMPNLVQIYSCWCKWGVFMGSQKKHSGDPCMGVCGMVRFILGGNKKAAPRFPISHIHSFIPPWKKSSLVFIKPKTKTNVQRFCAILKLSPLGPTQSAAGPKRLWELQRSLEKECASNQGEHVLIGERERVSLLSWLYYAGLWKDQSLFQTNKSISQSFMG